MNYETALNKVIDLEQLYKQLSSVPTINDLKNIDKELLKSNALLKLDKLKVIKQQYHELMVSYHNLSHLPPDIVSIIFSYAYTDAEYNPTIFLDHFHKLEVVVPDFIEVSRALK